MDDYILVLNAGSSSLKFCVFQRTHRTDWRPGLRGQIEGIGTSSRLVVKDIHGEPWIDEELQSVNDGRDAMEALASWLRSHYNKASIIGFGHRVVHGGEQFTSPVIITPEILGKLNALTPLAPLHQPHNILPIEAILDRMPEVPQVACFDTSFHRGHNDIVDLIPLPHEVRAHGIMRYGFHGISHEYIASVLPEVAPEIASGRVVVAHLGSGASLCALRNGKSVDSTMGFTALDGLCMGTRPGLLDPGVVLYLFQTMNLSADQVQDILYKQSGLRGISGISNDMRNLLQRQEPDARRAIDYFVFRAAKEIGALAAVLGGIDALVFTAGVGENSVEIRQRISEACRWLGVELDEKANGEGRTRISVSDSKASAWVIPTNEEQMIAKHTLTLLDLL